MTSAKLIFLLGLLLLLLSGLSIATNHHGFALRLITYAFWILCLATTQYIWESRINDKK